MSEQTTASSAIRPVEVPARLQHLHTVPEQLYARGGDLAAALARPCLAVVGSRKATAYGLQVTRQLAGQAAAQGITIISGLAYGIDACAHRAALDAGGLTIAVMAGGLDRIYPSAHRGLAQAIMAADGCLVSEYPVGSGMLKGQFVARNRLVAGLADGVLVTEASFKSGSRHTADYAQSLNREVFAVPGNITSPTSAGTNQMLRDGALAVHSINDILVGLKLDPIKRPKAATTIHPLVQLVREGTVTTEALLAARGLPTDEFNFELTKLELTGRLCPAGPDQWMAG